ncbi:MAG TPA: 5-bromo-4-chloroindolyl phosphate hydrolysis family protein [Methylomusa anaerophila]|uniref:5-bromo-4-chloroindolyl phosphate hydrolysis protein n=1 Tax=Methylomusa anaerophila TaxID=1930071 RepID=A0A348AJB8_9FIRM|nr:5-bromo-4-chloroindolyl phosphate hydrolysis family protein [Methylomusa anaerophila]BBB91166.1 hypothetical protein MAMMFC1_01837 [Methylomusa anaerophila]HML89043.1 5-bromo-4-chloroindolyl phosphate hydrolysis family protein [Methylomusa anaerophila]
MIHIYSGLTAGLTFLIFYLFLSASLVFAVAAAIAVFIAILLLFAAGNRTGFRLMAAGLTQEDFAAFRDDITQKAAILENSGLPQAGKIAEKSREILEYVRKKPHLVKTVRRQLPYYLEAVIKVLALQSELGEYSPGPSTRSYQEKVSAILAAVEQALQKVMDSLLNNTRLDLDVEIEILQKNLDSH